ncbi:9343_t:CDS:2, partial [Cetraspora pellucida]
KIEQNLGDDNNQNSEKEDSEKNNDKEEDANMIENDYEEELMKCIKERWTIKLKKKIEDEETSVIEKRRKKKSKCETLRNSELMIKTAKQILSPCSFESTRFQCMAKEFNLNIVNCSLALSAVAHRSNLKKIKVFPEKGKAVLKNENGQITLEPANYEVIKE